MDPVRQSSPVPLPRSMFSRLWVGRRWMGMILLLIMLGITLKPMVDLGYPMVHSIHFNMMWAFQYAQQFLGGQFYPRWLEGSYFGLGNPTFVFYPPLCMVGILPFATLGFSTSQALLGSMALAVGVRGLGAYRAARCLWSRPIAVAVALVALVTPYFMVDVYERGAIAEVWSLCLIPWVLWGAWRIQGRPHGERTWQDWGVLAGLIALMGLTHLPGLLVWTLVWLIWPWCVARDTGDLRRALMGFYGATLLGLGLVSFFLLPAALDQRWISIDAINGWDIYDPLQRFMIYLISGEGVTQQDYDRTLLPHFWIPLVLAGITWCLGWRRWTQPMHSSPEISTDPSGSQFHAQRILIYLVLITVISSLMMTDLSAPLYQASPTLTRIQFPWRWLIVTTSALPFFFGYLWAWVSQRSRVGLRWGGGLLILAGMGFCLWQGLDIAEAGLYNPALIQRFDQVMEQRPPFPEEPEIVADQAEHFLGWHWAYPEGIAFVDAFEYRPLTGAGNPVPPAQTYPLVDWVQGTGSLQIDRWSYGMREFQAEATQPGTIAIRTFAYPGWQVQQADQIITEPQVHSDGRIQLSIPPGKTQIQIRYRGTWAERAGLGISGVMAMGMVGVWAWELNRSKQKPLG